VASIILRTAERYKLPGPIAFPTAPLSLSEFGMMALVATCKCIMNGLYVIPFIVLYHAYRSGNGSPLRLLPLSTESRNRFIIMILI
jgi:hypothetical protein